MVGLDASRSLVVGVLGVIGSAAGGFYGGGAAVEDYQGVGGDALFHCGRNGDVDGSAVNGNGVFATETVPCAAAGSDFYGRGAHHAHVIIRGDAGLALGVFGRDGEAAAAGEEELALREENGLEVFLTGCRICCGAAVGKGVGAAEDHIAALFALVVDGRATGVGEGEAVKDKGLLVVGIQFQGTAG